MGSGLKGDALPPTTGFPVVIWFCNISHATVPPCSNKTPVLILFQGPAKSPNRDSGQNLQNQVAKKL